MTKWCLLNFAFYALRMHCRNAIDEEDFVTYTDNPHRLYEEECGRFPDYVVVRNDTTENDDHPRCSNTGSVSIIRLNVHLQNYAIDSIVGASKTKLNMILPEKEAIIGYIGSVINELNSDLVKIGVQIVADLRRYKTEDYIVTDSFDASCEIKDPLIDRTDESFAQLKDTYQNNIGLHLFVWTCPQDNRDFMTIKVNSNANCGRTVGVLWQGINPTSLNIKSSVMEAITGVPDLYLDGKEPDVKEYLQVCRYAGNCVGSEPGVVGWRHPTWIQALHVIPGEENNEKHLPYRK